VLLRLLWTDASREGVQDWQMDTARVLVGAEDVLLMVVVVVVTMSRMVTLLLTSTALAVDAPPSTLASWLVSCAVQEDMHRRQRSAWVLFTVREVRHLHVPD
jgi:hypothetical protein